MNTYISRKEKERFYPKTGYDPTDLSDAQFSFLKKIHAIMKKAQLQEVLEDIQEGRMEEEDIQILLHTIENRKKPFR